MAASSRVEVTLLFFAKSRELSGVAQTRLAVPSSLTGQEIVDAIVSAYPELAGLKGRFVVSLNQEFVDRDQSVTVRSGDEIAVIPPISGG